MQIHMGNKFAAILAILLASPVWANHRDDKPRAVCAQSQIVEKKCRTVEGVLEVFNGTPSVRLSIKGRKKIYAVGPPENELLPSALREKLTPESKTEGKFFICKINRKIKNGFQEICIDSYRP